MSMCYPFFFLANRVMMDVAPLPIEGRSFFAEGTEVGAIDLRKAGLNFFLAMFEPL